MIAVADAAVIISYRQFSPLYCSQVLKIPREVSFWGSRYSDLNSETRGTIAIQYQPSTVVAGRACSRTSIRVLRVRVLYVSLFRCTSEVHLTLELARGSDAVIRHLVPTRFFFLQYYYLSYNQVEAHQLPKGLVVAVTVPSRLLL